MKNFQSFFDRIIYTIPNRIIIVYTEPPCLGKWGGFSYLCPALFTLKLISMKKLFFLLLLSVVALQSTDAQNYEAVEAAKLYNTSARAKYLFTIQPGEVVSLIEDLGEYGLLKVDYCGSTGYVRKSLFTETNTPPTEKNPIDIRAITLSADIDKLSASTRAYRRSLNALYISTGVSAAMITSAALVANKSVSVDGLNSNRKSEREAAEKRIQELSSKNKKTSNALYIVGGLAAASTLISGAFVLEFQHKVNKYNTKLQLKANSVTVTF